MLIYQYNAYIFPLFREAIECRVDLAPFSLVVAYQEVTLRVWRVCDVADAGEEDACD